MPGLELVWSDPAGLLRYKLLPVGERTAISEVSSIFARAGVDARWSRLSDPSAERWNRVVVVVLTPTKPAAWGLAESTMGAVLGREGPILCVYVFHRSVVRALGTRRVRGRFPVGALNEIARAVGRVAAHEIVHAVSPTLAHTQTGLMRAKLSRAALRKPAVDLSRSAAAAFRKSVVALSERAKLAGKAN